MGKKRWVSFLFGCGFSAKQNWKQVSLQELITKIWMIIENIVKNLSPIILNILCFISSIFNAGIVNENAKPRGMSEYLFKCFRNFLLRILFWHQRIHLFSQTCNRAKKNLFNMRKCWKKIRCNVGYSRAFNKRKVIFFVLYPQMWTWLY